MSVSYREAIESVAAVAASHATEVDRGAFPGHTIAALRDAGMLGLVSSKDVGGQGEDLAAAAFVVERLARECGSSAMVTCMHYAAAGGIEQHGAVETRRGIAPRRPPTPL